MIDLYEAFIKLGLEGQWKLGIHFDVLRKGDHRDFKTTAEIPKRIINKGKIQALAEYLGLIDHQQVNHIEHKNFHTEVKVARLTSKDNGPVTGYRADIQITCMDNFRPFRFVGVPGGYSVDSPTTNVEGYELRIPIEPI